MVKVLCRSTLRTRTDPHVLFPSFSSGQTLRNALGTLNAASASRGERRPLDPHAGTRMFSTSLWRCARPDPRPDPLRRPNPEAMPQGVLARFRAWQTHEKNRKKLAVGVIAFYLVVGLAGIQYLKDTKHKALNTPSPYKKAAPSGASGPVEPHDTTPVYNAIAAEYDDKIWLEEITSYIWWMRRRLMRAVRGDALEVSCGTGRNVGWFKPGQVDSLTLTDASKEMLDVCRDKYAKKYPDYEQIQFVQGRAEELDKLAAKSGIRFDTVYESFGLCSHEDPHKALAAMARLLKPGGRIVLLEHGRGPWESMNKRMDEKAEERAKEWGCRWNLDIDGVVRGAGKEMGLKVVEEDTYHFGTIYWFVLEREQAA